MSSPAPPHQPAAKVVASIEARMGSTRLPGKVMMDIGGVPMLTRLVRRLRRAMRFDGIVLATTTDPADDALADWAASEDVPCFRGREDDALARMVDAQRTMGADIVVRMCGDTPLLDSSVIVAGIDAFFGQDCDLVTSNHRLTYSQGIDTQVFRFSDLEEIDRKAADPVVHEHVSLYFHEHPETFRLRELKAPDALRDPEQRLQVDYADDLTLVREIYAALEPEYGDAFCTGEIVELLRAWRERRKPNHHCREKPVR